MERRSQDVRAPTVEVPRDMVPAAVTQDDTPDALEIRVALLPQLVASAPEGPVALIDVLRTSTTVIECFARGARAVYLSRSADAEWSRYGLGADPIILAEVPGGHPHPDATLPPSPSLTQRHPVAGRDVVVCTVNGAAAAERLLLQGASPLLLAGLVNLEAAAALLDGASARKRAVTLVCAGYGGNTYVALDDVYVAGRIVARLQDRHPGEWHLGDSAKLALRVAQSYGDPRAALHDSATAGMLRAIGRRDDVDCCARVDASPIVPHVVPIDGRASYPVHVIVSPRSISA